MFFMLQGAELDTFLEQVALGDQIKDYTGIGLSTTGTILASQTHTNTHTQQ